MKLHLFCQGPVDLCGSRQEMQKEFDLENVKIMNKKNYIVINIFFLIALVFLLNVLFQRKEVELDHRAVVNQSTNSILMGVKWHAYIGKYYKDKENVEYISCDESVAKVSDEGKITGISIGKTNIIVKEIKNGEEKILKNYVVVVNKIKDRKKNKNNFIYRKNLLTYRNWKW